VTRNVVSANGVSHPKRGSALQLATMREFPFAQRGLAASADDNGARCEQSLADTACKGYHPNKEEETMMKLRIVAPLVLAASAAAIGLAPIAAADATVNQSPGNVQVTATPGTASQVAAQNQQPFGGDEGALLFHH
jgi:hypothetical protein